LQPWSAAWKTAVNALKQECFSWGSSASISGQSAAISGGHGRHGQREHAIAHFMGLVRMDEAGTLGLDVLDGNMVDARPLPSIGLSPHCQEWDRRLRPSIARLRHAVTSSNCIAAVTIGGRMDANDVLSMQVPLSLQGRHRRAYSRPIEDRVSPEG